MAMEWGIVCFVGVLTPHMSNNPDGSITIARQAFENCVWTVAIILPWAAYIIHFILTLCVRQRRSFLILMWILGGILILNLASCAYFFDSPPA
jgi:cbb3-type cytochrome oxidase subunit 1